MDEARIGNPAEEPYLVVSAVIVDADSQLLILEQYLKTMVEKHISESHRETFVFHAKELFNGGGLYLIGMIPTGLLSVALRSRTKSRRSFLDLVSQSRLDG